MQPNNEDDYFKSGGQMLDNNQNGLGAFNQYNSNTNFNENNGQNNNYSSSHGQGQFNDLTVPQ